MQHDYCYYSGRGLSWATVYRLINFPWMWNGYGRNARFCQITAREKVKEFWMMRVVNLWKKLNWYP